MVKAATHWAPSGLSLEQKRESTERKTSALLVAMPRTFSSMLGKGLQLGTGLESWDMGCDWG